MQLATVSQEGDGQIWRHLGSDVRDDSMLTMHLSSWNSGGTVIHDVQGDTWAKAPEP